MRWTFVVMTLGFFGLIAYLAKLRFELKRSMQKEKLQDEKKS